MTNYEMFQQGPAVYVPTLLLSLLITVSAYMAFPLIKILINKGKFAPKTAQKIALWNSIVVGLVFCILTIELSNGNATWSAAPAVLYYWINKAILTGKEKTLTPKKSFEIVTEETVAPDETNEMAEIKIKPKKYFKGIRFTKVSVTIIIFSVVLLMSLIAIGILLSKKFSNKELSLPDSQETDYYVDEIGNVFEHEGNTNNYIMIETPNTQKSNSNLDETEKTPSFEEWTENKIEKSNFLDEHIVFVIDGFENYYYTYDEMEYVTEQLDEYTYWAYNVEQVIDKGYVKSSINISNGWSSAKADFLDECIVFVIDGFGNYYYTYDEMMLAVQRLDEYEFWAYNKEQAIALEYKKATGTSNQVTTSTQDEFTREFLDALALPQSNTQNEFSLSESEFSQNDYTYKVTCLSVGCDNLPNNSNFYCSEHACAKSGCSSEKSYSSSFCRSHKCDSISCDNGANEDGYYCSEHACAENGCFREKEYSGNYCSYHECDEVLCENRKKGYSSYCSEHECADKYCSSSKAPLSDYCFIHDD